MHEPGYDNLNFERSGPITTITLNRPHRHNALRRKAKEWNLIGALFTAATAERYDLVNRVVAPADLTAEVDALCEVMLRKHPLTVRRTKFILNKGADLHVSGALAFEVPITPVAGATGIAEFTDREARARRRELSKAFWQDDGLKHSAGVG